MQYLFKTAICNWPRLKYTSQQTFWLTIKVLTISVQHQVLSTYCASHIGRKNRYLRPLIFQLYTGLYIVCRKTSTYDRQVSGTYQAFYFRWKNRYLQLPKSQLLTKLPILSRTIGICDRQVPSTYWASYFE